MASPQEIQAGLKYLRSCIRLGVRYVRWNGVWPPNQQIFYARPAPAPTPQDVHDIGCLCSGAINLFNRAVNEQHGWGTLWWQRNLTNVRRFDPNETYPVGTVLGYPFERDNDGHVMIVSTEPDVNGDQWTIAADTPFGLNEKRTVGSAHDVFNLTYAGEISGVGVIPSGQGGEAEQPAPDDPGPPPYVMLDSLVCPSPDQLERIYNHTNVWAYGFYLPEAPSHGWSYYRGRRKSFVDIGFGLAPIYVGQQISGPGSKILTEEQGKKDAQDAARKMKTEGFPKGDVCYLDVEGGNWSAALVTYAAAWINETNDSTDYTAGMYALPNVADAIMAKAPRVVYWACRADYACSRDAGAKVYQGAEGSDEYWRFRRPDPTEPHPKAIMWQWCLALGSIPCSLWGTDIDINSSAVLDPSKAGQQEPDPEVVPPAETAPQEHMKRLEKRLAELEKKVK
jgi:hypothetical protein